MRPAFKRMQDPDRQPTPTKVEIIERMSGEVTLPAHGGGTIPARVELTMCFVEEPLAALILPGEDGKRPLRRVLKVDREHSRLRVFTEERWQAWRLRAGLDAEIEPYVQFAAPLSGELAFMHREASTYPERRCRTFWAWLFNRGLRDIWQAAAQRIKDCRAGIKLEPLRPVEGAGREWSFCAKLPFARDLCRRFSRWVLQLFALASHGGEVRLFEYDLTIEDPDARAKAPAIDLRVFERARKIAGRKRVTYSRRSNPWRQMTRMYARHASPDSRRSIAPMLELDATYLTQQRVPLMRILGQQDELSALADLGSLAGYFLRLLMSVHVWSFRKPDPADPGEPQRLPGKIKGMPSPDISEFVVAHLPDGRPVRARLTRYAQKASAANAALADPRVQRQRNHVRAPDAHPPRGRLLQRARPRRVDPRHAHELRDADRAPAVDARGGGTR